MVRRPSFAEFISKYCCIPLNTPSNSEKAVKCFMHLFEWKICNAEKRYKYKYIPSKNSLKIVDEPDDATAKLLCLYHINKKK